MAYLGNTPASRFTSMDKQTITGDGGTDYTLDHAVGSEQEIEVFVNNVRQEPSVAYTVAGTALTMTGNVASTDDFYVVFQGKAQQSVTHPSNSALQATTGTFSGALSATTGTFSGAVSMGANNITFSDGSGIDFSASAGSGATSSILNDYEEGAWTVEMYDAISGGNASSTTVTGYYTKIGKLVTARFYAMNNISTSGLTSGNAAYFTLPFASSSTGRSAGSCTYESINLGSGRTQLTPTISASQSRLQLTETGDNVTDASIAVGDFNGTSSDIVTLSITYAVD